MNNGFISADDAFKQHVVEAWGATAFASMHTASSGAEYKRAFIAGFNAAKDAGPAIQPDSVLLNAIALCLKPEASGVHGVFIDVAKFRKACTEMAQIGCGKITLEDLRT